MENLRNIDVLGLTEKLDEVLYQLKFHLRGFPFAKWPEANEIKPTQKSELDNEAAEIMRRWAWVDLAMYEKAEKIFRGKTNFARRCMKPAKG